MHAGSTRSLRPSGIGRYVIAAFLSVWLVGWIVTEVIVITMLGTIFGSIGGVFPEYLSGWSADLVKSGGVAVALLFVFFWLTLWTIGGLAALTQLMRSLVGEDVIGVTASGFELVRRAGPFRRRYAFDRSGIRRLRIRHHDKAVVADTAKGTRVITTFGLPAEREDVADWRMRPIATTIATTNSSSSTPRGVERFIRGRTTRERSSISRVGSQAAPVSGWGPSKGSTCYAVSAPRAKRHGCSLTRRRDQTIGPAVHLVA
jgi:hypothetical protein